MAKAAPVAEPPRRFCAFFFGNGVAIPKQDSTDAQQGWSWFPRTAGADYTLTKPLEPLALHRDEMSIFGGMSHPSSRMLVGHNTVDVWLTGADIRVSLDNSISLDQLIARHAGTHTRIPSLVLSSHGGVGTKSRSTTISFDTQGRAVPAESSPRRLFERLFQPHGSGTQAVRKKALASSRRRVDFLLEDSHSLRNNLGKSDQIRLDEFVESLHELETRLTRAQNWLGKALPRVEAESVNLDVSPDGPTDYIRTMMDVIVLALQTDTTRVTAYQICAEDGVGICDRFPTILGIGRRGHHQLTHSDGELEWAHYDRYLAEQFAYFLGRLSSIREGDSRLLDNTMALFGSATSTTHNARNYPTILAGGSNLGLRHGRYFTHETERPMGDLYVTILKQYGIPIDAFAESTGEFAEILA
ncbi:MAG: DUF1552 domain-containing protein [bacterium]|nr:DUF1552 domain-containing protein [bacterium]